MASQPLKFAIACVVAAATIFAGLTFGEKQILWLGALGTAVVLGLVMAMYVPPQALLNGLLAAGFMAGWMKLYLASWLGYILPDALCVLLIVAVLARRQREGLPLPYNGLTLSVLALTLFCLLELFHPDAPLIRSLAGLRSWLLYTWLMFVGYEMLQSTRQLHQTLVWTMLLAIGAGAYGLYQWKM